MQAHYPPHYVINQFRPAAKDAPLRQRLVARQLERIDSLKVRRVLAACPLDSQARVLDRGHAHIRRPVHILAHWDLDRC